MNSEVWQKLLSLESQEVVKNLFSKMHKNKLNTRRAKEINSSAKQAREYFRNASNSDFSVKPLLSFYGISSLSRSLILLMNKNGGEERLSVGHGLATEGWSRILAGDLNKALEGIGELKIRTTSGLFTDFIRETENRMNFHVNSSNVDWSFNYPIPQNTTISLSQILSRLPDLYQDILHLSEETNYASINNFTYNQDGFICNVLTKNFKSLKTWYVENGFEILENSEWTTIKSTCENFEARKPQFTHSYVQKSFGSIPSLFLSKPFEHDVFYSQLGITYMASYYLGMLVRYYPTQWIQLINGGAGDNYWPIINRLHGYVEQAFPELVIELILELSQNDI